MAEPQRRNNEGLGSHSAAIEGLGSHSAAIISGISWVCRNLPPSFAIAIKELTRYLSISKQTDLHKELKGIAEEEAEKLIGIMRQARVEEPKGAKLSKRAKAYSMIRYIQKETHGRTEATRTPGAWMGKVARDIQKEWDGQGGLF
jgi:hypothetical protein